jgi:hypothetical protein
MAGKGEAMEWGWPLPWWQFTILAVLSALWEFYVAAFFYRAALLAMLLSD